MRTLGIHFGADNVEVERGTGVRRLQKIITVKRIIVCVSIVFSLMNWNELVDTVVGMSVVASSSSFLKRCASAGRGCASQEEMFLRSWSSAHVSTRLRNETNDLFNPSIYDGTNCVLLQGDRTIY